MNVVPCKDCVSRNGNCHANCVLYKEWKIEHENYKVKIRKQKKLDTDYVDYVLKQRTRIVHAKTAGRNRRIVSQL